MIDRIRGFLSRTARLARGREHARHASGQAAVGYLSRTDADEVVLLAYDLRSLLVIISRSSVAIRERADLGLANAGEFNDLDGASERAHRLAHRLMSLDRRSRRAWRPIDINIVVSECSRLMQRIVGEDIRVTVEPGVGNEHVLAERIELERILLTIAMSARRAMPAGGALVIQTAALRQMPPRAKSPRVSVGTYVRLTFAGTETGILPASRIAVVRDKPLRGFHGIDLGVAVIAHTVRSLDGTLHVVDDGSGGSRVLIDLPCIDAMGRAELIETT